ncbi:MAG TPA: selenide, water dikinase SelD, partial [Candidatus Brocadiales bacterium]|nr:selenide, water dikinase SelD [Candidatus Brocadiales bacterium]
LDFFTPIVDDPYDYGQIAAANALSDVYAMGGRPLTAMNILAFPMREVESAVISEILRGSAEKVHEAGAVVVGGHTLQDTEIKFGLSVTGLINPEKVITNAGARPEDVLVLTKPLGGGLIISAYKAGEASGEEVEAMTTAMKSLNAVASEVMQEAGVNACTDITGFGLLGHGLEMALASRVTLSFQAGKLPLMIGALRHAQSGLMPAASVQNKHYVSPNVRLEGKISDDLLDILYGAETSGGLLVSLSREKAETLLKNLHSRGVEEATVVGEVIERQDVCLVVKP